MTSLEHITILSETGVEGRVCYPVSESESLDALYRSLAVIPGQTHALNVRVVEGRDVDLSDTDAVVTFLPGVPVGVRTADCVPVLLYAPDVCGVAAVHAGWRGTLGGIVENTVRVLVNHGADPANMIAAFGPSISKEIYEVGHDMAHMFVEAGFGDYISYPDGPATKPDLDIRAAVAKPHIDLQGINIAHLVKCGLTTGNIRRFPGCTYTSVDEAGRPIFPSHRRSQGAPERLLTYITLR